MTALSSSSPQLAPPGAGLPKPELFMARLIFSWGKMRSDREKSVENYARRKDEILRLVQACPMEIARKRVLIRRLPGLEDSSRYWSVYMTLDHLRIVNLAIAEAISSWPDKFRRRLLVPPMSNPIPKSTHPLSLILKLPAGNLLKSLPPLPISPPPINTPIPGLVPLMPRAGISWPDFTSISTANKSRTFLLK
jgi:hypothetical protein